jgi:hypothetical protein
VGEARCLQNGRMLTGTLHVGTADIYSNTKQYNLEHLILGGLVFDLSTHPWRIGGIFDAIVTDRKRLLPLLASTDDISS